ncbi:MAG: hypothetical protein P8X96_25605 [Desulfobacteraceae bacterium]
MKGCSEVNQIEAMLVARLACWGPSGRDWQEGEMKYMIFPSKRQWQRWAAPSKITAVGACLGTIGLVIAMMTHFAGSRTSGQQVVKSNVHIGEDRLVRFIAEKDRFETLKSSVHQKVRSIDAEQQDLNQQLDALNRQMNVARTNMINAREDIREIKQQSKWHLEDVNVKYELILMDSHTLFELNEKLGLIKKRQAELEQERRRLEASEENVIAKIEDITKQMEIEK